jgi:hypothetical protein
MGDNKLIRFVLLFEDHRHLIGIVEVTKDPVFEVRFEIYPNGLKKDRVALNACPKYSIGYGWRGGRGEYETDIRSKRQGGLYYH